MRVRVRVRVEGKVTKGKTTRYHTDVVPYLGVVEAHLQQPPVVPQGDLLLIFRNDKMTNQK